MKKIAFLLLLCLASGRVTFAQSAAAYKVLGIWLTTAKDGKTEIFRSNNKYCGKSILGTGLFEKDGNTSLKGDKNPDPKLRGREGVGLVFITDLTCSNGEYTGGELYHSTHGNTYKVKMKLINDDRLKCGDSWDFHCRAIRWNGPG